MGLHPLLIVDFQVCFSQREWVQTLFYCKISKSILQSTRMGLHPFANGECQSLPQLTRMGLYPSLMLDVKSTGNIENEFTPAYLQLECF